MLPSVRPLTSSPKKRLQSTGGRRSHKRVRPTSRWAARRSWNSTGLRDSDENSLDRVVDAEWPLDHVAAGVELNRQAEQRCLDADLGPLDLLANLGPRGGAVLAGTIDRACDDLRRDVRRSAE